MVATMAPHRLPPDADVDLDGRHVTGSGEGGWWTPATHCCEVDVSLDDGRVRIERFVVVEDCGTMINPAVVDGQIRGGVAHGVGGVFLERAAYGPDGQFLAGTWLDYLLPTATDVPSIEVHHLLSADDGSNFRGVGEGGAMLAPAAISNAVADALAHLGVEITEQYLPPSRILELAGVIAPGDKL
jgi:carbon-monoxide dehydrogenase large subunit